MKKILITIIFLYTVQFSYSQEPEKIRDSLTTLLEKMYSRGFINGFSVAIVDENSILYSKGFGFADAKNQKKYTKNTIQPIASISKTFIGIALLKAQEMGKLNLEDPINKYLPFSVINPHHPDAAIRIRNLATHTSGIKDPIELEKRGYVLKKDENIGLKVNKNFRPSHDTMVLETFLKNILSKDGKWYKKSTFMKTKPGDVFEYSNIGAGLAGLVLEKATGISFKEFTKKHIFSPLGMTETGWFLTEIDSSMHSKLYTNKKMELAPYRLINYPDGALITSAVGLGTYLSELIAGYSGKGKLLQANSYQEFFRPQLSNTNFEERNDNVYNDEYNMGVFMGMSNKGQMGHTGGDPGVGTYMFFNTKTNLGKILMVNTDLHQEGIKEFFDIWEVLETYENKF